MNKQELINRIIALPYESYKCNPYIELKRVLGLLEQLDEPQPIKLKDVIARIKVFDGGTQKVWLNEILNELGSDYGSLKYKAGYEQGEFEGTLIPYKEPQKVAVPQFVSEYIEFKKTYDFHVYGAMREIEDHYDKRVPEWFYENNIETFVRAWLDGYEVEEEKRYLVKLKGIKSSECYLSCVGNAKNWIVADKTEHAHILTKHTRKELEEAGFGEVFNSPLFEVEEVEE